MPKVSIILPSYNHQEFLRVRLDSIQNQTFDDWELIIIDDCSQDQSIEILKKFIELNKLKVKHFILNETNSGSGFFSWQRGIELSEGEYIWIAETDDYCNSNFLEETVKLLESNLDTGLVFVGSNYVNADAEFLYDSSNRTKELGVLDGDFGLFDSKVLIDELPLRPLITNGSSVLFRRPIIKIPQEIFSNRQMSDLFLWRYLLGSRRFIFLNKKINYFRRHESSTTTIANMKSNEELYAEYTNFVTYFDCSEHMVYLIVKQYVSNFLFSDHNKKGLFYFEALKKIKQLNGGVFKWLLFKAFLATFFLKIKKLLF